MLPSSAVPQGYPHRCICILRGFGCILIVANKRGQRINPNPNDQKWTHCLSGQDELLLRASHSSVSSPQNSLKHSQKPSQQLGTGKIMGPGLQLSLWSSWTPVKELKETHSWTEAWKWRQRHFLYREDAPLGAIVFFRAITLQLWQKKKS